MSLYNGQNAGVGRCDWHTNWNKTPEARKIAVKHLGPTVQSLLDNTAPAHI